MNTKIWIVTPYDAMQSLAEQVLKEQAAQLIDCDFTVTTSHTDIAGFQNSLTELRKATDWGAEVIISRGGTAVYIAQHTDIPVVEIQVTALDILQAFRRAKLEPTCVGIAGSENITYECDSLYDFLGLRLRQISLRDDQDYSGMQQAINEGVRAIVGDAVAIRFAASVGIPGYLIESGKASIYKAIREAVSLVQVRRKEQTRSELLQTVIDASVDGIVAIDDSCNITLMNQVAEKLFRTSRNDALGRSVESVIPNTRLPHILTTGLAEIGEVQRIGAGTIATKRIPIKTGRSVTGAIATFQEVSQLQSFEHSVRRKLHDKSLSAKHHLHQIIGESEAINNAKELARTYAVTDSTVLITGESGTGKELFAQSIHNLSPRRKAPFVAINCAALPENLLESELFGYEEGAFSGAKKGGKTGLVELAHGGTLFLDEIAEMPLPLQARILRMLQEKEVMRIGGHKVIPINVRILCATNQDLYSLVESGRFREDLYYRLDVLSLHLPPLRERPADIDLLAKHFIAHFTENRSIIAKSLSEDARLLLLQQRWPGNVRELSNVLERLVLLSSGAVIDHSALEKALPSKKRQREFNKEKQQDPWAIVEELRQAGLGARRIAKLLSEQGHDIKYYQIAYRMDKGGSR